MSSKSRLKLHDDRLNFELNGIEEDDFRFCGRENFQSGELSVYFTCKHNTERFYLLISKQENERHMIRLLQVKSRKHDP